MSYEWLDVSEIFKSTTKGHPLFSKKDGIMATLYAAPLRPDHDILAIIVNGNLNTGPVSDARWYIDQFRDSFNEDMTMKSAPMITVTNAAFFPQGTGSLEMYRTLSDIKY